MRSAWVICLLAACRSGFDTIESDASQGIGPFGPPQRIAPLASAQEEDDPSATGDGLELYFMSSRTSSNDLFVSYRAARTDAWGAPQPVAALNSADDEQSPGITSDGLTIYFSSSRPSPLANSASNIWRSTRTSRSAAWPAPVFVGELSSTRDDYEAQPDANDLRLVLYRIEGSNRVLLESVRASTSDPWGTPTPIPGVDSPGSERSPCLAEQGLALWFGSDRSAASGVHDIYVARRPDLETAFDAPVPVPELNTNNDDNDPWLSPDGHLMIFASDDPAGDGLLHLFETTR